MAIEKEIKLSFDGDGSDALAWLTRKAGQDGERKTVSNAYYDTPEHALARAGMALRVRQIGSAWRQTLKTRGGARDGLHVRHEWELPLDTPALDIEALLAACDAPQAAAALRAHAARLEAVFSTDFTRTAWTLTLPEGRIEAAVDLGEVHADRPGAPPGRQSRVPIAEVELELIDGDEAALESLAAQLLSALPGLRRDDVSKAQRGYLLLRAQHAEQHPAQGQEPS